MFKLIAPDKKQRDMCILWKKVTEAQKESGKRDKERERKRVRK